MGCRRGNTSTDVENTFAAVGQHSGERKHLHGRAEDLSTWPTSSLAPETPPRAWRRPRFIQIMGRRRGNTSTGVEKTFAAVGQHSGDRKHLHGRGEDPTASWMNWGTVETPPR